MFLGPIQSGRSKYSPNYVMYFYRLSLAGGIKFNDGYSINIQRSNRLVN